MAKVIHQGDVSFCEKLAKFLSNVLVLPLGMFPSSHTGAYYGPIDFGLYSVKVISTDNSVQRLRNKKLNKTKCDFLGQIRLVTPPPDPPPPPPPPPPGGGFSGGLSENECKYLNERDHKIAR